MDGGCCFVEFVLANGIGRGRDNTSLVHLNDASILQNLKARHAAALQKRV